MLQFGPFKWVPKKGSEKSVARILKPSIRFERSVCTDMEPCFIERRAEMSEDQKKAYKQLIAQGRHRGPGLDGDSGQRCRVDLKVGTNRLWRGHSSRRLPSQVRLRPTHERP
jgi:hypothetical protein